MTREWLFRHKYSVHNPPTLIPFNTSFSCAGFIFIAWTMSVSNFPLLPASDQGCSQLYRLLRDISYSPYLFLSIVLHLRCVWQASSPPTPLYCSRLRGLWRTRVMYERNMTSGCSRLRAAHCACSVRAMYVCVMSVCLHDWPRVTATCIIITSPWAARDPCTCPVHRWEPVVIFAASVLSGDYT